MGLAAYQSEKRDSYALSPFGASKSPYSQHHRQRAPLSLTVRFLSFLYEVRHTKLPSTSGNCEVVTVISTLPFSTCYSDCFSVFLLVCLSLCFCLSVSLLMSVCLSVSLSHLSVSLSETHTDARTHTGRNCSRTDTQREIQRNAWR